MVQYDPDQDYSAVHDRRFDFTQALGALVGTPTLSTATVVCGDVRVLIANKAVASPYVTYRISQSGMTTPTWVDVVCHAVCSDGQELEDTMSVHFENT